MNSHDRISSKGSALIALLIASALLLAACDDRATHSQGGDTHDSAGKPASAPAHGHEHHAPRGGALIELGEEFAHLELLLDETTGTLTAYVLDGEAEQPVRLKDPALIVFAKVAKGGPELRVELAAVENKLTGEQKGDTSEFRGTDEHLKGLKSFDGRVERIMIKGQEFKDVRFIYPKGNE